MATNACLPYAAEAVVRFHLALSLILYVEILVDPEMKATYHQTDNACLPDRQPEMPIDYADSRQESSNTAGGTAIPLPDIRPVREVSQRILHLRPMKSKWWRS